MDFFTLTHLLNSENWKACKRGIGAYVAMLVALGALVPGAMFKLFHPAPGDSGFWDWLWGNAIAIDENFIDSRERKRVVDLKGGWRFAIGDDPGRASPDFDDSSWSSIGVPAYWEKQGFRDYDGYAWYRREFKIDAENAGRPLYAFLGKIDDVDEVFINGRSIGGLGVFPPDSGSAWNLERVYRVPPDVVQAGNNVIAVRVYDGGQGGGIAGEGQGLYTTDLPQPLLDLSGRWKFRTGDNPDWKSETAEEGEFKDIQVPVEWAAAGYRYYDGHAWYRKTFGQLPVFENETLILFLGKIDDTDEVFLNGERIGRTGGAEGIEHYTGAPYYNMNRRYEFTSDLLKETNTLAVHVYDGQQGGGIYSGPIGIMKKTDFLEYQRQAKELDKWRLDETVDWLLGRDSGE